MKNKILTCLGFVVFIGLLLGAYVYFRTVGNQGDGPLTVICVGTEGDADSTLLCQSGAAVLIDTGEEKDAEHILAVLREQQVDRLDYLILSHGDADHIGGAKAVLAEIPVGCVVESPYEEAGEKMTELNEYLREQGIPVLYPTRTWRLHAGQMQILAYPPLEKHYNDNNNASLVTLVQHENVNLLFAGDALRKRSEELLMIDWPKIDLYKVPHHGRQNTASGELFERLKPEYGVVTAKSADEAILEAAERNQTRLFYTRDGDCRFVSDGQRLLPETEQTEK